MRNVIDVAQESDIDACAHACSERPGGSSAPGQLLPVGVLRSRQLDTQKPPVLERNVTPAEVPPKAAGRGQAEEGQQRHKQNKDNQL